MFTRVALREGGSEKIAVPRARISLAHSPADRIISFTDGCVGRRRHALEVTCMGWSCWVTHRWLYGLSHAAVASVLGVSEEAARKLVARVVEQLRMLLKDYAD